MTDKPIYPSGIRLKDVTPLKGNPRLNSTQMKRIVQIAKPRPDFGHDRIMALVVSCNEGSNTAREELARLCLERVKRTVVLTHGYLADMDDIVQIVMARIFSNIESFRAEASFFAWVDRISINVVSDHFRSRWFISFRPDDMQKYENQLIHTNTPEIQTRHQRLLENLSEHFMKVMPSRRMPLALSLLHGYTMPEVAAMLDISVDAAKKRFLRGRRDLLKYLKKDPAFVEFLQEFVQ